MAFEKGMQKIGGRTEGVSNRASTRIRNIFEDLLNKNIDKIQKDLDGMKPVERVNVLLKLAEFCIPRLQAVAGELFTPPQQITIIDGTN